MSHPRLTQRWPGSVTAPESGEALLRRLHQGELFVYEATKQTGALIALARRCVEAEIGAERMPAPGRPFCPTLDFATLSRIRERLYAAPELLKIAAQITLSLGLPAHTRLDLPRLRMVSAGAEKNPAAAPVYVVHRDTWYACPQAQVNWWMPLFDCPEAQAFAFYPDYFERPVDNGSEGFDYERWMREVGWHGSAPIEDFPAPRYEQAFGTTLRFELKAGELLLFSAAHLHQTWPNPIPGTSRLSIDFRSVTTLDPPAEAPNVDNGAAGDQRRSAEEMTAVATLTCACPETQLFR